MKRILFLFLLLALTGIASAQSNPPLTVQEVDGSPKKTGVTKIVVSNGTLTISGTTATITTGGGGGGGLTVGTTAIASGTAGRFLYETSGNVLGEVSTLTSDGTILTFSPTVTTGTGATSGLNANANSLTTGDAFNFASSSVTSGNVFKIAATGTAAASNTKTALNVATSGANATSTQTTYGAQISNTSTGTSSTNVGLSVTASGGASNFAIVATGRIALEGTSSSHPMIRRNGSTTTTFFRTADDSAPAATIASNYYAADASTNLVAGLGTILSGVRLVSGYVFAWTASATSSTDPADTALARAAAAVIRATNGSTGAGGILVGSSSATGTAGSLVVASANADSLTVGPNGLTNPILQVVGNVASAATGLSITGNAAGSGVTLTALSSGSNEKILLTPKGTGSASNAVESSTTFLAAVNSPFSSATNPAYAVGDASRGIYSPGGGVLAITGNGWTASFAGGAGYVTFNQSVSLSIGSSATALGDVIWRRAAAASLAFGAADAAAPVAQTLSVQNVVGGTSNTAGANWTLAASRGTGTGTGGDFIVQTAPAGGSGTTQNALAAAFTVKGNGAVELKTVTFANLPTVANAYLIYCSDCTIASPCASGGSGALAKGINGAWVCN